MPSIQTSLLMPLSRSGTVTPVGLLAGAWSMNG